MTSKEIDLSVQRKMLKEMRATMALLCEGGDDFLLGHYSHILERIDAVLAITETDVSEIEAE